MGEGLRGGGEREEAYAVEVDITSRSDCPRERVDDSYYRDCYDKVNKLLFSLDLRLEIIHIISYE